LFHQSVHPGQSVIKDGTPQLTDAGGETAATLVGQMAGHHTQQRTLQRQAALTQTEHIGNVHKACGAPTDPVGVFFAKSLVPRNDKTTLGGMIREIGGHHAVAAGQILGLLKGEAIAAHQGLKPAIGQQADHDANTGQKVANLLTHADAIGAAITFWGSLGIVIETMETANKSIEFLLPGRGQFAKAKFNTAIMANANEGSLAGSGAIIAPPDPIPQLEITQWHGDFAAIVANMALIHGSRKVGQGATIGERFIFPVPALKKIEAHMAGINGQVEGLRIGAIEKTTTFGDGSTGLIGPAFRGRLGQPGGHGDGPRHDG
jgi:hypothetical protein